MSYSNILVAVADLHRKVCNCWQKRYLSLTSKGHQFNYSPSDPEMYNQLAAPMAKIYAAMQEETQSFLDKLIQDAGYPVAEPILLPPVS